MYQLAGLLDWTKYPKILNLISIFLLMLGKVVPMQSTRRTGCVCLARNRQPVGCVKRGRYSSASQDCFGFRNYRNYTHQLHKSNPPAPLFGLSCRVCSTLFCHAIILNLIRFGSDIGSHQDLILVKKDLPLSSET